jgi:hypothetical protein
MPVEYGDWKILFEKGLRRLNEMSVVPIKVKVNSEKLAAWCHSERLPINRRTLSVFVSIEAKRLANEGG